MNTKPAKATKPTGSTWQVSRDDRVTSTAAGLDVDGYVAQLSGEPPIAKSHGWGDLSWLRRRNDLRRNP